MLNLLTVLRQFVRFSIHEFETLLRFRDKTHFHNFEYNPQF